SVDPIRDAEIIETELMLADLESITKQADNLAKKAKGDKDAKAALDFTLGIKAALEEGKSARTIKPANEDETKWMHNLHLLTATPILYVCNVNEEDAAKGNEFTQKVAAMAKAQGAPTVIISAAIEAEIAQLESEEEKKEFLSGLDLDEPGLNKIIRAGYSLLA